MKDRFTVYGIVLMIVYIGWYMWNQKVMIGRLDDALHNQHEVMIELKKAINKQRELIQAQEEYIKQLERECNNQFFGPKSPLFREPI